VAEASQVTPGNPRDGVPAGGPQRGHRVRRQSGAVGRTDPGDRHPPRRAVQPARQVPLAEVHAISDGLRAKPIPLFQMFQGGRQVVPGHFPEGMSLYCVRAAYWVRHWRRPSTGKRALRAGDEGSSLAWSRRTTARPAGG